MALIICSMPIFSLPLAFGFLSMRIALRQTIEICVHDIKYINYIIL